MKGCANPPWSLIGKVLSQVRTQQAQVVLIALVWRGQPWYLVLLELLWDYPRLLPQLPDLFQMTSMTVALDFQPQLAVWPISGESMPVKAFQEQLGISSCPPGEPNPMKPMILTSRSGYAGTLQGV